MPTATRQIPFGRPWILDEERAAVRRVLDGHILTHGPEGARFEEEFAAALARPAEGAQAVSTSSCMAALHMAAIQSGLGPGDEVVVPAQTHVATAHAVEWVGARPVFVDCEPTTGNMDAARIEAALTSRTRAIVLVHFLGIPCDMTAIGALARRRALALIEDCALAVGARWAGRHVGLFGDAGCFSFYPVKHLTTAEGGMFLTRRGPVAEAVRRLRAFGVDRSHQERSVPGMYDVPTLGLNYRMSELQAAIGRVQLQRLEANLEHRRRTFARLAEGARAVPGLRLLDSPDPRGESSHYCLSVVLSPELVPQRDRFVRDLGARGIGTSIYYPHPVPRLLYYRTKYGYHGERYPNAAAISDGSFALPVGWHVTDADVDYMVETLHTVIDPSGGGARG